jgi:hypothetical protein
MPCKMPPKPEYITLADRLYSAFTKSRRVGHCILHSHLIQCIQIRIKNKLTLDQRFGQLTFAEIQKEGAATGHRRSLTHKGRS